jgi:hypothetical protein
MNKLIDNAAFIAALFFLGIALGFYIGRIPMVCPTEDSCTIEYYDSQWHILPVEEYTP